jgi:hypothetical protein
MVVTVSVLCGEFPHIRINLRDWYEVGYKLFILNSSVL